MDKLRLRKRKHFAQDTELANSGFKCSSLSPCRASLLPQLRARGGVRVWRGHRAQPWPSWPTSVQIPVLLPSSWAPAILVSSLPRVLALGVFCPLQTAGSQAPPISFLLSSNVSVSMKPVLSTVFHVADLPTPCFLSCALPPIGRLANSLLVTQCLLRQRELHKGKL